MTVPVMGSVLSIWIPGAPASPNRRGHSVRARMVTTKTERTKAYVCSAAKRAEANWGVVTGPARITFTVHRHRLLDPVANLPASLKAYQDGVCDALLPLGDGNNTPYQWLAPVQRRVHNREPEGVAVTIERL